MRNKEWDGDVFWTAKMMKFHNNEVWERWVMDNGVLEYVCCVVIYEEGFCKRNRERDGNVFMSNKMIIFQNNGVWERWAMDNGVL